MSHQEQPNAPANTPENHQEAMPRLDATSLADAVIDVLAATKPDVAVGIPTIVPPNSPERTFLRNGAEQHNRLLNGLLPVPVMDCNLSATVDDQVDLREDEEAAQNNIGESVGVNEGMESLSQGVVS